MTWTAVPKGSISPSSNITPQWDGICLLSNGDIAFREISGTSSGAGPDAGGRVWIYQPDQYGDYRYGTFITPTDRMETHQFGAPMFCSPHDGKTIIALGGHPQYTASAAKVNLFNRDTGVWTQYDEWWGIHPNSAQIIDDMKLWTPNCLSIETGSSTTSTWGRRIDISAGPADWDWDGDFTDMPLGSNNGGVVIGTEFGWALCPDGSFVRVEQLISTLTAHRDVPRPNWAWEELQHYYPKMAQAVIDAGSTGGRAGAPVFVRRYLSHGGTVHASGAYITYATTKKLLSWRGSWLRWAQNSFPYTIYDTTVNTNQIFNPYSINNEVGAPMWSPKIQRVILVGGGDGSIFTINPADDTMQLAASTPEDYDHPWLQHYGTIDATSTGITGKTALQVFTDGATIVIDRTQVVSPTIEPNYGFGLAATIPPDLTIDGIQVRTNNGRWTTIPVTSLSNIAISFNDASQPTRTFQELTTLADQATTMLYLGTAATKWTITVPADAAPRRTMRGDDEGQIVVGARCATQFGFGQNEGGAMILPNGDYCYIADINFDFGALPNYLAVWDGTSLAATKVVDSENRAKSAWTSSYCLTPDGRVMIMNNLRGSSQGPITATNASARVINEVGWVWTPSAAQLTPDPSWVPTITSFDERGIYPGGTFELSGTTLSGVSLGTYSGDDNWNSTNLPMCWLTNKSDGTVVRCHTHHWSYRGIQPGRASTMLVTVPGDAVPGSYEMRVGCNGIWSAPTDVAIGADLSGSAELVMMGRFG